MSSTRLATPVGTDAVIVCRALPRDGVDSRRFAEGDLTSERVGRAVLERLRHLDEVLYLRFASVYKGFDAASDFQRELSLLKKLQKA